MLTRNVNYSEVGTFLFTVPGANCREDFPKVSEAHSRLWASATAETNQPAPVLKVILFTSNFSFPLNENYVLLLFCPHRVI